MIKTYCDICGKEMSNSYKHDNIKDLNFAISSNGRIWDICNECRDDLWMWITQKKFGLPGVGKVFEDQFVILVNVESPEKCNLNVRCHNNLRKSYFVTIHANYDVITR